jgi:hypothetical protein
MITHNPLHRSGRAVLPHPAPTSGDDAHSPERVGMADCCGRKPSVDQPSHSIPVDPLALTSTPQREVPIAAYLVSKICHRSPVHRHPMVPDESADYGAKPLPLFRNRLMHALSEFGLDLLKFPAPLLSDRLADDRVPSVTPLFPANMREAQEVEGLRSPLISPLSVLDRKRTEFQKPRLLGIERQAELSESLLQLGQTALRLHLALQPDHKVVRPSHDDHVAPSLRPPPVLDPQIQDVVKKHVRQKRGDNPALRRAFFDGLPLPLLPHAGAQPFLDEPYDARVTDAILDELHEPFVVKGIEKATNVRIDDPVHLLRQHPDIERIQTVVLVAPWPVAVGEAEKRRLVDGVEAQDRCILDDLVLKHRYAQRPLFSIGLWDVGSADGFGSVSPTFKPPREVLKIFFKLLSVLLPRLPIHTSGRIPLEVVIRLSQGIRRPDVMHETCALELLIPHGSLAYPPQRTLHPFPALNPADVLLSRVPLGQKSSLHPLRGRWRSGFVRGLRRYYPSVRLPLPVHHRRTPLGFPTRPALLPRADKGSPGSRAYCFRACDGSLTPQSPSVSCLNDTSGVAFRISLERRHSGSDLTRLNTMPARSFHNASRLNLRTAVHDQVRCGWLTLHRAELSSANNTPVYPGTQGEK